METESEMEHEETEDEETQNLSEADLSTYADASGAATEVDESEAEASAYADASNAGETEADEGTEAEEEAEESEARPPPRRLFKKLAKGPPPARSETEDEPTDDEDKMEEGTDGGGEDSEEPATEPSSGEEDEENIPPTPAPQPVIKHFGPKGQAPGKRKYVGVPKPITATARLALELAAEPRGPPKAGPSKGSKRDEAPAPKPALAIQEGSSGSKKKRGRPSVPKPLRGQKNIDLGETKKKRKKGVQSWATYLFKIFKEVHADSFTVSTNSMGIMNSLMSDIFERICTEASRLTMLNKRRTLGSREIMTATKLVFPGELSRHAINEGSKALERYRLSAEYDNSLSKVNAKAKAKK